MFIVRESHYLSAVSSFTCDFRIKVQHLVEFEQWALMIRQYLSGLTSSYPAYEVSIVL